MRYFSLFLILLMSCCTAPNHLPTTTTDSTETTIAAATAGHDSIIIQHDTINNKTIIERFYNTQHTEKETKLCTHTKAPQDTKTKATDNHPQKKNKAAKTEIMGMAAIIISLAILTSIATIKAFKALRH